MLGRSLPLLRRALNAQRIEGPQDLRRHPDAAPLLGSDDERGKDQRETRAFPGEPRDHLRPPPAHPRRSGKTREVQPIQGRQDGSR